MGLASCATNPVTGKKEITLMTEQQELELGRQAAAEIERQMPAYQDDRLQRYVSDIGMRLAKTSERPRLPWQFTVVDASAVNAFALPGGYVYITRGILPYLNDESELAGVLGHEIGHVAARHTVRQYTQAVRRRAGPAHTRDLRPVHVSVLGPGGLGAQRRVPEVQPRRRDRSRSAGRGLRSRTGVGSARRPRHADDPVPPGSR